MSPGVRVEPIIEVEESPYSRGSIANCSHGECVELGIELSEASTSIIEFVVDLSSVDTLLETNTGKSLSFLQHL